MKKIIFVTGIFAILFLSGCGSSVSVFHDLDPTATFDQYKTYSFLDWTDGNKRTLTEPEREQIRVAIAKEVESLGYTFQQQNADLKIQLTVYFRNARRHRHHYYRYYGYPGYPGMNYNSSERALAVDMFEGAAKKHVWHSAVVGYSGSSIEDKAEGLSLVASSLFEEYPGNENK